MTDPTPVPEKNGAPPRAAAGPFRVVTANVQSFPNDAMSLAQALEDLQRNAEDGDVVLLQEIATRYKTLVQMAFPAADWLVYYGRSDNSTPIAFRRALFSKLEGRVDLLHPARKHLHFRRYITQLRLRYRPTDLEFHVTNLHLVAGAFNDKHDDQALRRREWDEGIAKHLRLVERLVETGLPVVGGGDYNRRLGQHKSLGTEIAGRRVTYAVDGASIDLLWFVDGDEAGWGVRATKLYPGRHSAKRKRHSDHGMRRATVTLTGARTPAVPTGPQQPVPPVAPPPLPERENEPALPSPPQEDTMPGPYELTQFGDGRPKRVDWITRAALEEVESRLGYPLTIVQGSYNHGGVAASAGTHDGGGVVDLLAWDWKNKVKALRAVGFAAWYRAPVRGLWGAHIHAVLIGHDRLAPVAARQVTAYRNGRDGLRSNRHDGTWRPSPIPSFRYPPAVRPEPPVPAKPGTPTPTGSYPGNRSLDGVDTSHHQGGRIDVKAAQAAGLRWWYLKTTEGDTVVDKTYRKRVKQARAAGIPVGAYHFARPDPGDAQKEARFFLEHADIRAGDMLPMLDLESLEGMSAAAVTTWTGRWVQTVTRDLRRRGLVAKPIIYTPFDLGSGFGCLLWVARYSNDFRAPRIPQPWRQAAIWQHSNGRIGPVKNVPGFGSVDVNAMHPNVKMSALRVTRVRKPAPVEPPAPPTPPVPEMPAPSVPAPVPEPTPEPVPAPAMPAPAVPEPAMPAPVVPAPVVPEPATAEAAPSPPAGPGVPEPAPVPALPVPSGAVLTVPAPALPSSLQPAPGTAPVLPAPTLPAPITVPVDGIPQPARPAELSLLIDLAVARVQLQNAADQIAAALDRLPER